MVKNLLKSISCLLVFFSAVQGAGAVSVEKKLKHQFERYQEAQNTMLNMEEDGKFLTRQEYEQILAVDEKDRLSSQDLQSIEKVHNKIIQKNKERAQRNSIINLDLIRSLKMAKPFCSAMPKGGMLHIHPSGTASLETMHNLMVASDPAISFDKVQKLVSKKGAEFYPQDIAFLNSLTQETNYSLLDSSVQNQIDHLFILPAGPQLFPRFQGIFSIQVLYKETPKKIKYWDVIYHDFLTRAAAEHVKYVEFTKTFQFNDQLIAETEELVKRFKEEYGITVKFNFAFIRTLPETSNADLVKKLLDLPSTPAITGIDLLAEETNAPALEAGQKIYIPLLKKIKSKESNLHMTMHAGELGDVHNVRDALIMGADRIGHGVRLINDPVALEYARRKKTPIEINLVSNERLGVVHSVKDHPFLKFLRLGLKPSLSTDDEGIFETDINRECVEAIDNTDIQYAELKTMVMNSIETSFASDQEKSALLSELKSDLNVFESKWTSKTGQ